MLQSTRREFLHRSTAAACALAAARGGAGSTELGTVPNIVFLFSDDQRFDTIAALGNSEIHTPNMDRLVARGVAFMHATIMGGLHGAICVASRAMMHTGRHLFHLGGTGDVIPPSFVSLPETLRAAGYRTYATGKWHSDKASFNRYYNEGGPIFFGGMNDHFNAPIYDYDPSGTYPMSAERTTAGTHDAEVYTKAAVDFISQPQAKPFFLYVAYTAPHDPRVVPEEFRKIYDPAKLSLPPNFMPKHPFDNGELNVRDELLAPWPRTPEIVRRHTADYYAAITHLDTQIGRILDALDVQGLAENTIIAFAGDNGISIGRHGLFGKQSLYEDSIRVPFMLSGPGIPANTRRDCPCYIHDLFPTLCHMANIAVPPTVESVNLVPALRDASVRPYATTFHAYRDLQRAVRGEEFKLIEYHVGGETRSQVFDVKNDPWELNDLSATEPGKLKEMQVLLNAWRDKIEFH